MAERLERSERCPACGGSPPDLVDFGCSQLKRGSQSVKLFDVGKVVSSSIGMAAAMSLSSLFLWKSDWLSVPSGPSTVPMAWELQLASW